MTPSEKLEELLEVLAGPPGWRADIDRLMQQRELAARIDELYKVRPVVHRIGYVTYAPRMVTLESIAEQIAELKRQQTEAMKGEKR